MAVRKKKRSAKTGCLLWAVAFLVLLVLFLVKFNDIRSAVEKTGFLDALSHAVSKPASQKKTEQPSAPALPKPSVPQPPPSQPAANQGSPKDTGKPGQTPLRSAPQPEQKPQVPPLPSHRPRRPRHLHRPHHPRRKPLVSRFKKQGARCCILFTLVKMAPSRANA